MNDNLSTTLDKEQLRALVAETLDVDVEEVTDDARFVEDLEADSLLALEIVVKLENTYGVKLDEAVLPKITTLQATYELLDRTIPVQR